VGRYVAVGSEVGAQLGRAVGGSVGSHVGKGVSASGLKALSFWPLTPAGSRAVARGAAAHQPSGFKRFNPSTRIAYFLARTGAMQSTNTQAC
jgi:hypothetical protein